MIKQDIALVLLSGVLLKNTQPVLVTRNFGARAKASDLQLAYSCVKIASKSKCPVEWNEPWIFF